MNDDYPQEPPGPPIELFRFWKPFIKEKKGVVRSASTISGFEMMKDAIEKFSELKDQALRFDLLDQDFFNDLISHLIHDHLNQKFKKQPMPERGLHNSTIIKRLKDFGEYLNYCKIRKRSSFKR